MRYPSSYLILFNSVSFDGEADFESGPSLPGRQNSPYWINWQGVV
jgi:hypothetical protein